MKSFLISIFLSFLLIPVGSMAQKYDYRWINGLGYSGGTNIVALFSEDSCDLSLQHRNIDMEETQVTISDSNANFLFACNGQGITNAAGHNMSGADNIDTGWVWYNIGYAFLDAAISVPTNKHNLWNLFTSYMEYNPNSELYVFPWQLRQHRIDMSQDSGRGALVFHDSILIQDTLNGIISVCQHGNGRDWWLLVHQYGTNCFYELLIEPDTILNMGLQCLGDVYQIGDAGQAEFSPDGTKYAICGGTSGINIYDFDRCSGELGNPVHLPIYASVADSFTNYQYGLSFSPNSRFLYVAQIYYILQFDVTADSVFRTLDTVGIYQPPPDSFSFAGNFFVMQLAPNGKIYICSTSSIKWWHVINDPDEAGAGCGFVNYGQVLPQLNVPGFPNYPNYRLGREIGSECDTIYHDDTTHVGLLNASSGNAGIKMFPNPAMNHVIIDYGNCEWSYGPMQLEISDESGRIILLKQLPMYSGFQQIDISKWAEGYYTACIKRSNAIVSTAKFIKQ